ncbi:MAG: TonB-dependent receptor [Mariniphaga sp.]|nr:TonB-dependent receptor [Mariniphaga sp.]
MKNQSFKLFIALLFAFFIGLLDVSSQNRNITGKLINAIDGKIIPELKIGIKGSGFNGISNNFGEFNMNIPDSIQKIEFNEFPDMEILEIKAVDENTYQIYLSPSDLIELSFEDLFKIKVNVSSTKSESVFHTPSSVSIVDREMLNQYNFLSVAEMLRTVVGFDIYQTNLDDNVATARGILQNYYANKILVMIENIPTYQPIYGNTNLDRLDVNDIERIEVLKGPASVLYGSNAFLGVVNIILRKGKDGDVNVRLATGYHRLGSAGANVTFNKNDFSMFISGNSSYEIQKPYELTGKRQDLYQGDSVINFQREVKSSNFNVLSTYKSFTFLLNNYEYQHTFFGINPSFLSGAGKPMTDRGSLLAIKYRKALNEKTNLLADLAFDYFKRDYASNQDGSTALMLSGNRIVGTIKLNYQISQSLDLDVGLDVEQRMNGKHVSVDVLHDQILKQNLKNAGDINEISSFAQLHYKSRIFNLLGGFRYTNNSFSGDNYSGRISTVVNFSEYNSLKLIFGQSFRAPTMLELFFDHPTVVGNLNLKPEQANSVELAYVHGKKKLYIQMLGYYQNIEHLIQRYTPPTGPPSMYQNLHSIKGYGFEFEAKYQLTKELNGFFNYNFMDGLGEDSKLNYQHVPKHTFKAGLNKSFGNFFASVNGYAVSSVLGNPKLNIPIDGQFMMDGHLGFNQTLRGKKLTLRHTISAKNVTASQMLIPEYIRQTDNINSQETTGFGRRFIYTLAILF